MSDGRNVVSCILMILAAACMSVIVINMGVMESWPPVLVGMMPTSSMSPYIEPGDIYTINRSVKFHDIKPGDVIIYKLDHITRIAHRVVEVAGTDLITKGDSNQYGDPYPVTSAQYVGLVEQIHKIAPLNALLGHLPMDILFATAGRITLMVMAASVGALLIVWIRHRRQRRHGQGSFVFTSCLVFCTLPN